MGVRTFASVGVAFRWWELLFGEAEQTPSTAYSCKIETVTGNNNQEAGVNRPKRELNVALQNGQA